MPQREPCFEGGTDVILHHTVGGEDRWAAVDANIKLEIALTSLK